MNNGLKYLTNLQVLTELREMGYNFHVDNIEDYEIGELNVDDIDWEDMRDVAEEEGYEYDEDLGKWSREE